MTKKLPPKQRIDLNLPLHDGQQEVADDRTRFKVLACGRRWGKTRMCIAICLKRAIRGQRVWWVAPVYQTANIAWRQIKMLVQQIPKDVPIEIKEADKAIMFPSTGGEIWFKSSDIAKNLRGEGLNLAIMDEADFQEEGVWTQVLRPALSDKRGDAIFISTPNIEGGWFHRLHQQGASGEFTEINSWTFTSYTNPFLDPAEIDAARAQMPEIDFRREFLAEFVSATGARIQRAWLKYVDHIPYPPPGANQEFKVVLGVDLAISERDTADYTAIVVIGRNHKGEIYVLDADRIRGSFQSQIDFIKSMAAKWQPSIVAVEDAAYQRAMVQTLQAQTTLNVMGVRPDKDKIARFAPVESRYESGQVFHLRGLPSAFESELLSFPVAEHDDMIDAFSCCWMGLEKSHVILSFSTTAVRRAYATPSTF